MLVIKSHFDSKPARFALASSAPICFAISPASCSIRSVLSFNVPSCCWNNTVSKRGKRSTNFCFKSVLKKNSASVKRGRTTFSLPSIIAVGSSGLMFDTKIKCGNNFPSLS